jgi:hypothetical protein
MTGSWLVFLCILLLFAFFAHLMFLRFCRSIAAMQGRQAEYLSNESNDDVGTNDFVREQFEKISRGKFDDINDANLVSLAWEIRRRLGIQAVAVVALIASGIWIHSQGCFT